MTRTQIQLPDALFARAKRLAVAKEVSFAELARRGLELVLAQSPEPEEFARPWRQPSGSLGWKGWTHEEIKDEAQRTAVEDGLRPRARRRARV